MLKRTFSVERAILFGSKARGDFDKSSDIDLLVITSRPLHWREEKAIVEALFDLGRHIMAKCFGKGVSEYKEIAEELERARILSQDEAKLLRELAGYRNRLVHFYHDVTKEELYEICKNDLGDILIIRDAYLNWFKANPEKIDEIL